MSIFATYQPVLGAYDAIVRNAFSRSLVEKKTQTALANVASAYLPTNLPAGARVTLTTNYVVGSDGDLKAKQTDVSIRPQRADESNDRLFDRRRNSSSEQQRLLSQLTPIKPSLTPVEEVSLYSQTNGIVSGEAVDANGIPVQVDIIDPDRDQPAQIVALNAYRRSQLTLIYARNNDIVFGEVPLARYAA